MDIIQNTDRYKSKNTEKLFLNQDIGKKGPISKLFLRENIKTIASSIAYVSNIQYGRTKNRNSLEHVILEGKGTCSTKHALLSSLFEENSIPHNLLLGILKMNRKNTPEVKNVLSKYFLDYIPEAYCYIRMAEFTIDATKFNSNPQNWEKDLLKEVMTTSKELISKKTKIHQEYLREWLVNNPSIPYSLDHLWVIREECISELGK